MIESALQRKNICVAKKITIKSLVSLGIIAAAILLPQLFHTLLGSKAGITWLPMYLPILLGGCILGWAWGLGLGVVSPIISFALTSIWGSPMPALTRLPFMIVELSVFATVTGLFSKLIAKKSWMSFIAVLTAELCGRSIFLLLAVIFHSVSPLTPSVVWQQIVNGFVGLGTQAIIVPLLVIGLNAIINREHE